MRHERLRFTLVFHAVVALLGWTLARAATVTLPWCGSNEFGVLSLAQNLGWGLCLGELIVWLTRGCMRWFRWARSVRAELCVALEGFRREDALWLAVGAGVGEEILFRGLAQGWSVRVFGLVWGWILVSIVFGALHVPRNRRLVAWTLMAIVIGAVLGQLSLRIGLLSAIVAHAWINFRNLRALLNER